MQELATLKLDYSIKVSSRVYDYLSPDYIYIPVNNKSKIYKKNQEKVLKNEVVVENKYKTYSSISGKVDGVKEFNKSYFLKIENDFKEKNNSKLKNILTKNVTKEKINEVLNSFNIKINEEEILVLNLITDEPYIVNDVMYFKKNLQQTLELLDTIKEIFGFKSIKILAKNNETDLLTKLNNVIGTYPDLTVITVPNKYLISKKENYKNFINFSLNSVEELNILKVRKIYNALYKSMPLTEKYITVSGNGIKNPLVINAKIGTLVTDIINDVINIDKNKDLEYFINGLMTGYNASSLDGIIVNENLNAILIVEKENNPERQCIKCGLCNRFCPLGIDPIKLKENNKIIECLNCGLCSYICPSNIVFETKYKEDKDE